jgi:two-component sensor histidine kinase
VLEFETFAASDPRPSILTDTVGTVVGFNSAAQLAIRGLAKGRLLTEAFAEPPAKLLDYLRRCARTRSPVIGALAFFDRGGGPVSWRCDGGLVTPQRGDVLPHVIVRLRSRADAHAGFVALKERMTLLNRELRYRKQLEGRLRVELEAKSVLLAEVNHRVKNNLQVIISLLSIASRDPGQAFEQTVDRVRAMGRVQQLLYEGNNFREIECTALIKALVSSLDLIHKYKDVAISIDCDDVRLDAERATSLGLLINELVSNAFKHAFPRGRKGTVLIRLTVDNKIAVLSVTDDGVPMPPIASNGTGLTIARALAQKLGGELEITTEPRKAFGVAFDIEN